MRNFWWATWQDFLQILQFFPRQHQLTNAGYCSNKLTNQMQHFLQVYYLTFMCRSTCFGHLHAHHQELTTALTASGFTLERGGSSVVSRGLAGRIDHD